MAAKQFAKKSSLNRDMIRTFSKTLEKLPSALYGRGLAKINRGDVSGSKADIAAAKGD
jgi:hypothetical protein